MVNEIFIPPRLAQWAVIQGSRVLNLFAILQGAAIIVTDAERWSATAYENAMLVPGAPPTWGWLILAAGILTVYGGMAQLYRFVSTGFYLCAIWCIFFAGLFGKAFFENPDTSAMGLLVYSFLAIMYVGLGEVYRNTRKARDASSGSDT